MRQSNKYWAGRVDELITLSSEDMDQKLISKYREAASALIEEVNALYARGIVSYNDLYRTRRYYELVNNINARLVALGSFEIKIINKGLENIYARAYQLPELETPFSFTVSSEERLKKVLSVDWVGDGKNWSSRIWSNKSALADRIKNGIIDNITRGRPLDRTIEQVKEDFNVGFREAQRIVRTESAFVVNQATAARYIDAGFTRYEYIAAHDDRVDSSCHELDGKIFKFSNMIVGTNFPPMHSNCRCCIAAIRGF